jgi:hypothetical protein
MRLGIANIGFVLGGLCAAGALIVMCSDDTVPFDTTEGVTDPYCIDTPTWFEELTITATYSESDPKLVVISFEPNNEIVDVNGLAIVEGATIDSLVLDDAHRMWLVLAPDEGVDTITVHSAVDCTTETQLFDLILYLHPDENKVTFEIRYPDENASDAGDVNDAGV